ncbi:MAG TPA: response regulator [Ktedonobacterales bacterium]|nr:response regulator [Ktedonobacterales bacterium]
MAHVLVVDDDASIRDLVRMVLEDEGYAVAEAADGQAALDLLRVFAPPAVVIVDGFMPRLSGLELLAIVAREPGLAWRHAYVLATGSSEIAVPLGGTQATAMPVRLLAKPFDIQTLLEVVAAAAATLPSV